MASRSPRRGGPTTSPARVWRSRRCGCCAGTIRWRARRARARAGGPRAAARTRTSRMRYHVGYEMTATRQPAPAWTPRQIVDDGKKLYLLYPEVTLFAIGPAGARDRGQWAATGQCAAASQRGHSRCPVPDPGAARGGRGGGRVVTITRGKGLRTITCPDDGADCPQWPAAARHLARRTP